jgi:hypothetical protein
LSFITLRRSLTICSRQRLGQGQQPHVEALVGAEEVVPLPDLGLQLLVQLTQLRQVGVTGGLGHLGGRIALEQGQQPVDLADVLSRHLGDVGAPAHLHGHQAFDGQHLQRPAGACG